MSFDEPIKALHAAYLASTGFDLPLTMQRYYAWEHWVAAGLTPADVRDLVRHHQGLARQGKPGRSLLFRSLVERVDFAEEDLALIRARGRGQKLEDRSEKREVLQATGRRSEGENRRSGETVTEQASAEVVARLLAELKKAAN